MNGENEIGESERWLSVIGGGMLVLSSLRRRDAGAGVLFALAGGALIFRGIVGHDGLADAVRGAVRSTAGSGDGPAAGGEADDSDVHDEVHEASLESFPASDPPSWTPTSGPGADDEEDHG
jgi:hypothetical protein